MKRTGITWPHTRLVTWAAIAVGMTLSLDWGISRAASQEPDGAALYRRHCGTCHGAAGVPSQRMLTLYPALKPLTDPALQKPLSVDSMVTLLRLGTGGVMKPYTGKLSDAEMATVAKFVKTLESDSTHAP